MILHVRSGLSSGLTYELSPGEHTIGRARGCTLRLPDPLCSRVHCRITVSDGVVHVEDLESKHGLKLGEQSIQRAAIEAGQEVIVGNTRIAFVEQVDPAPLEPEATTHRWTWDLVGKSPPIQALKESVERFARARSPVLIEGETGTGKELVARSLHGLSGRADRPFVAFNCAALGIDLAMDELFGHEAGAFTGALRRRLGLFELADGGTLFLDEVGEAPPELQAALLRVIQEETLRRVGGSDMVRVDVRLIAATHRDLEREVEQGRFREDLYFRLRVLAITVPPLRERPSDVPILIEHFLTRAGRSARFSEEALERCRQLPWPGNVRQLKACVERVCLFTEGDVLGLPPLEAALDDSSPREAHTGGPLLSLKELERAHVERVLAYTEKNMTKAAEILGISRSTLYEKLKRFDAAPEPDPGSSVRKPDA